MLVKVLPALSQIFLFLFSCWCYHQESLLLKPLSSPPQQKGPFSFHSMLSLSQSRLVNVECFLLPGPNPTFVLVVFAQLGAPDFSFPWHCSLALPALLVPLPGEVCAGRDVLSGRMLPRRLSHSHIT